MRRGSEDRPLVLLQHFQPAIEIAGVRSVCDRVLLSSCLGPLCSGVLKMNLSVSQTAHCFWRTGKKPQTSRGSAVKDWPKGGHRPAQARHERGRLGGSRSVSVAPILDGTGDGIPQDQKSLQRRQATASGQRPSHQGAARGVSRSSSENRANSEPGVTRSPRWRGARQRIYSGKARHPIDPARYFRGSKTST